MKISLSLLSTIFVHCACICVHMWGLCVLMRVQLHAVVLTPFPSLSSPMCVQRCGDASCDSRSHRPRACATAHQRQGHGGHRGDPLHRSFSCQRGRRRFQRFISGRGSVYSVGSVQLASCVYVNECSFKKKHCILF